MFWRRKTQSSPDGGSADHPLLTEARAQFAGGEAQAALGTLRRRLMEHPADRAAHALAARILRALDAPDEAGLFGAAARDPQDVGALYDLGYHFIEVGQPDFAVPFLQLAHAQAPTARVASELAVALNASFRPAEAVRVLGEVPGPLPFWPAYEQAWSGLLTGRPGPARDLLAARVPELAPGDRAAAAPALNKLEQVLARLEAVDRPEPTIRDWHFIQYGGVILDFMDGRTDEDAQAVAGGRWVVLGAGEAKVRGILTKLGRLLDALDLHPGRVAALPDRDSQIVGRAAALALNLPFLDDADVTGPDQLLVAAQAADLAGYAVREVAPGQVTFALNLDWLRDGGCTPDVVGVLTQVYTFPWQGGLGRVHPETGALEPPVPDHRDPAQIAADLAASEPEPDPDFGRHLAFYQAHQAQLTAGRAGAVRLPFRRDSPVPGRYFS